MNFTDKLIAQRYNQDRLILLPINPNSSFAYWEITDKTLEKFGIDPKNVQLSFKLFDAANHEIVEFSSSFATGDYYINHESDHKSLYVKLFLNLGGELECILCSNIIAALQSTPKSIRDDLIYTSALLGEK
ncbi:DUF4912 domain-containing protein [Sulfurimonas sp.]|uniref:DUF4912 domain-containing protein n=1 Tax=Sulfurimonas sp. TaxID=2022749 RepID=UPI0019DBDCD4|nr:DUF4912 domain-containing protein [Sulfurimonas sp.]MBE0513406.1 DUF4912 domain-containing protein [Sulfurimonas sp.]